MRLGKAPNDSSCLSAKTSIQSVGRSVDPKYSAIISSRPEGPILILQLENTEQIGASIVRTSSASQYHWASLLSSSRTIHKPPFILQATFRCVSLSNCYDTALRIDLVQTTKGPPKPTNCYHDRHSAFLRLSWENPFTLPRFSTTHSRDMNSQVALVLCPWREMHMGTTTPPRLAIVYLQTHVKAFAAGVVYNSMSLLLVRSVRSERDFKVVSPPPSALATATRDRTALLKRHIKLHSSRTAHCFMDII